MTGLTLGHHFARGGVQCRKQGGFMYKPTISRTLSTKKGSVESLKWFCRWGCKPNVRQMRWTASFDRPVSAPIERTDHCVSSSGLVFRVLYTTSATCSSLIDRGAPGRRSSCKPESPLLRKRWRHLPTVAPRPLRWASPLPPAGRSPLVAPTHAADSVNAPSMPIALGPIP